MVVVERWYIMCGDLVTGISGELQLRLYNSSTLAIKQKMPLYWRSCKIKKNTKKASLAAKSELLIDIKESRRGNIISVGHNIII